jgi:hypothetical protein
MSSLARAARGSRACSTPSVSSAIIEHLDMPRVLSNPETCRSLRTLFGWHCRAIGRDFTDVYQLASGGYLDVARSQFDALPGPPEI